MSLADNLLGDEACSSDSGICIERICEERGDFDSSGKGDGTESIDFDFAVVGECEGWKARSMLEWVVFFVRVEEEILLL